jgi:type IV secretory pathway TraG/TraD family ATPase VirD4
MSWVAHLSTEAVLTLALILTAVPLYTAFWRARAPLGKWLVSPAIILIILLVGDASSALLMWILHEMLGISENGAVDDLVTPLCFVALGYFGGQLLASPNHLETGHKRGSILEMLRAPRGSDHKGMENGLTIAGVPLRPEDETKHFKMIGTTGTGKSTAIRELLTGALKRGDRAVIADPDGGYAARFYDPYRKDVILNPFDGRSVRWDPFAEIENPYDVEQLSSALIAAGEEAQAREWRGYARTFLSAVTKGCIRAEKRDLGELWRLVNVGSVEDLRPIVAGTAAQPFLEPDSGKMFGSIRSVAISAIAALEYIQGQRAAPFSVRDWVKNGQGVLFIPYQASQIAALRGVIAAWIRLAIFQAMSRGEGDQKLWFVVDELDALGTIDGLKDALARLRKFGGRCVLGFQSIAQVSSTYGDGDAQTIVENCGNTLILRCSASEGGGTAKFASQLIGDREMIRPESFQSSSGPSLLAPSRGGFSTSRGVSHRRMIEAAVLPSEIEQLPDLAGYFKQASNPAWLRVNLAPGPRGS